MLNQRGTPLDLIELASKTTDKFANYVRDELKYYVDKGYKVELVCFELEERPGSGKSTIISRRYAYLLLLVEDGHCFFVTWDLYVREDPNRTTEDLYHCWFTLGTAKNFLKFVGLLNLDPWEVNRIEPDKAAHTPPA